MLNVDQLQILNLLVTELSGDNKHVLLSPDDIIVFKALGENNALPKQISDVLKVSKEYFLTSKLMPYKLDDESVEFIRESYKSGGAPANTPESVVNKVGPEKSLSQNIWIRPEDISAVVMTSGNSIHIFRRGLSEPFAVNFNSLNEAKLAYGEIIKNFDE